jgi:hypothetical protein
LTKDRIARLTKPLATRGRTIHRSEAVLDRLRAAGQLWPQADLGNERAAQISALAYKCNVTSTCKYQSGDYSLETFPL